jgi:hypothetical protein
MLRLVLIPTSAVVTALAAAVFALRLERRRLTETLEALHQARTEGPRE